MTEKQLQDACMLYASSKGFLPYHFQASKYQLPNGEYVDSGVPVGWPDLTLIHPDGYVLFAELKVGHNKPTKDQKHYLSVLPNAYLCYDLPTFKKAVNETLNKMSISR